MQFVSYVLPNITLTFFFALFWSALFEVPASKIEMIFLNEFNEKDENTTISNYNASNFGKIL